MFLWNAFITPPDVPSAPSEPSEPSEPEQVISKASTTPAPQLNLPQNEENSATTLMPPPTIIRPRTNDTTSSALGLSISTLPPKSRPRQKVVLAPGHSPLDWARLKASGTDLRVKPSVPQELTFSKQTPPTSSEYLLQSSKNTDDGMMHGWQ